MTACVVGVTGTLSEGRFTNGGASMIRYVIVVAALLGVLTSPGLAQFTGYGLGGQFLLMNKSVQEELKLSDDQLTQLRGGLEKLREEVKGNLDKIREMEPEERAKLLSNISEQTNKFVGKVLDEGQVKRLREIDLQQRGPLALYDPEVRKALKISDEQLGKLKELATDS